MTLKHLACAASLLVLGACSRGLDSEALGIRYEPPSGMKLVAEEPGLARFEDGLELRVFRSALSVDAPATALEQVRTEVPSLPAKMVSAKPGTIPAGKVARWELDGGRTQTLVYAVDGGDKHLVLTLTAPDADFDRIANKVERSLSSLKFR